MPEVHSELFIGSPIERVYSLAKDIERLPEFLPNVERVTVKSREGSRTVSEWLARVPEFNRALTWVEEDEWDDAARRCTFRAVSGDWDRYHGVWGFAAQGDGTQVSLDIGYEYNVPLIGALIRKLLHKLVARSAEETLEGLRKMAEETS
ncbi:MAG TPA: SRPBCC family protein [Armatimonadota bacterium]|nr:SRPBCC family protein [Armatimonadota bacterium]